VISVVTNIIQKLKIGRLTQMRHNKKSPQKSPQNHYKN